MIAKDPGVVKHVAWSKWWCLLMLKNPSICKPQETSKDQGRSPCQGVLSNETVIIRESLR